MAINQIPGWSQVANHNPSSINGITLDQLLSIMKSMGVEVDTLIDLVEQYKEMVTDTVQEVRVANVYSDLRQMDKSNTLVVALGHYAINDGDWGIFYWDETSVVVDDGSTVFKVDDKVTGRWIKVTTTEPPESVFSTTSEASTSAASLTDITSVVVDKDGINEDGGFRLAIGGYKTNTGSEAKDIVLEWSDGINTDTIDIMTDVSDDMSWYFDMLCSFDGDVSSQSYTCKIFSDEGLRIKTGDSTVDFNKDVTFTIQGNSDGVDSINVKNFVIELF